MDTGMKFACTKEIASTAECRPEVQEFARLMEGVLRINDWKGGWQNMDIFEILNRLFDELRELDHVVQTAVSKRNHYQQGYAELIYREAADVANFAMFLADVVRAECGNNHNSQD